MNKILSLLLAFALTAVLSLTAHAQCNSGNCSRQNATLGESISQLPSPVIPAPAPAPQPQIAYYTTPSASASAAASASAYTAPVQQQQLIVSGYYAQPVVQQPQIAYYTVPVAQPQFATVGVGVTTAASTAIAPANVGVQVACQRGGCGRRFGLLLNIRARRTGSFSKSVAISRN